MHLVNENAQKFAAQLAAIEASKRIAHPEKSPPAQSSCAGFLTDGKNTVAINLDRLRDEHKRPVWEWIKTNRPGLAGILSSDPVFADLRSECQDRFGATTVIRLPTDAARKLGLIR